MSLLIRYAEPEDALAVARVHVRSWRAAYRGLLPNEYLSHLRAEERADKYDLANRDPLKPLTVVAVDRGSLCGFATVSYAQGEKATDMGELCALYADPNVWNLGVGRALIKSARALLRRHGFRSAELWVLRGNSRAAHFYERDGWKSDGTKRVITVWGVSVEESRYVRAIESADAG